jgi:hypothetical protein
LPSQVSGAEPPPSRSDERHGKIEPERAETREDKPPFSLQPETLGTGSMADLAAKRNLNCRPSANEDFGPTR